jgi:anti-anti-sigma regulatory factor
MTMAQTLTYPVATLGSYLSTRDLGAKARSELEQRVRTAGEDAFLILDFSGVEAVTISFADEFLGRLSTARAAGDLPSGVGLMVTGLNEDIREAIDICLQRRGLAIVEATSDTASALLGGDSYLQATYQQALRLAEFGAGQLAEALKITPQNANNRLKRLVSSGVLRRVRATDRAGKEYAYSVPSASLRPA